MSERDIAVMVLTCDAYRFAWDGWYFFWRQYWAHDLGWPVYLLTEESKPDYAGVEAVPVGRCGFTDRVRRGLGRIEARNLLFWLDDYWLDGAVDPGLMLDLAGAFREHEMDCLRVCYRSGHVALKPTAWQVRGRPVWEIARDSPYKVSFQAGLWKRGSLLEALPPGMDIWRAEKRGSERLKGRDVNYCQYVMDWYANALTRGEWSLWGEHMLALMEAGGNGA